MSEQLENNSPGSAQTEKPQYTRVSAYGLVTNRENQILLCRLSEKIPRWHGYWTLPGGGLDFGEDPKDAVVREVKEETGVTIRPTTVVAVDSIYDCSQSTDFHGVRILYNTQFMGGELQYEIDGTTDKCQWWSQEALDSLDLVDITKLARKLVF
ncbi:MAG: NUDIX domain-containing protein [Cyanobacteria bacterium J06629_19]